MSMMDAAFPLYWNLNLGPASLLALASCVPFLSVAFFLTRRRPPRQRWTWRGSTLLALLLLNPCAQWIVFDPINMGLLGRMAERARAAGIVGNRPEQIEALFGRPTFTWNHRPDWETWNYKPMPFYLLGSKFQVHFKNGLVDNWEAFDD